MGNKLGRRRQVVDDRYTKPQGLYPLKDVDYKKLRKLILESKLAPCYPGGDECDCSFLEECPICFLYYPALNRSRCCMKSICTECFLQMKNPNSTRPTQCPFCKTSNYAVEYRGGKSKEERGLEQIEEQKVIEAKIRMRQQELMEEEERMHKRQETSSSSRIVHTENIEGTASRVVEGEAVVSSQDLIATPVLGQQQYQQQNWDGDFDLDLEDVMVMEAIWLSIQENGGTPIDHPTYTSSVPEQFSSHLPPPPPPPPPTPPPPPPPLYLEPSPPFASSSPPSGGLACAIAALAECQQIGVPSSSNCYYNNRCMSLPHNMLSSSNRASRQPKKKSKRSYPLAPSNSEEYLPERMAMSSNNCGDWITSSGGSLDESRSDVVEAGTSYTRSSNERDLMDEAFAMSNSCSDESEDGGEEFACLQPPPPPHLPVLQRPPLLQQQSYAGPGIGEGSFQGTASPMLPESFEEQMMLAMAVSLAEAQARTTAQGVAWH